MNHYCILPRGYYKIDQNMIQYCRLLRKYYKIINAPAYILGRVKKDRIFHLLANEPPPFLAEDAKKKKIKRYTQHEMKSVCFGSPYSYQMAFLQTSKCQALDIGNSKHFQFMLDYALSPPLKLSVNTLKPSLKHI